MINHFFPCRKANQAIVFQPQFGKFYYDNKSSEMGADQWLGRGWENSRKMLDVARKATTPAAGS